MKMHLKARLKPLALILALALVAWNAEARNTNAESRTPRNTCKNIRQNTPGLFQYQGEISLSAAYGIEWESAAVNLEIVNGIRWSRYLYTGVGIGLSANTQDEPVFLPLFVDVKAYLPVTPKTDLLFGLDLGTRLDFAYDTSGGLLFRPQFGFHFPFGERTGLNLSLFYELYSFKAPIQDISVGFRTNYLGLRLGFHF